jgi:hypothetical protein
LRIDGALALGYSYDEVAQMFLEMGIKFQGSTLKKYHLQEKQKGVKESPIPALPEIANSPETKKSKVTEKSHDSSSA